MNEKMSVSPLQKLSPLVLRLGIAAALTLHGLALLSPSADGPTGESVVGEHAVGAVLDDVNVVSEPALPTQDTPPIPSALSVSPAGVSVQTPWTKVVGGAEIVVAFMFVMGILTRLTAMGLLGVAGYSGLAPRLGLTEAEGLAARISEILPQAGDPTLLLLAVLCTSLLISGCGCMGIDNRRSNKQQVDLTAP